jgi:hypothetical protein
MNLVKTTNTRPELIDMLYDLDLVGFQSTYISLSKLLARLRRSTHGQVTIATPPGQATIPADPSRTDGSTSSTESKPELNARGVVVNLLDATTSTISKWMRRFQWAKPDTNLRLVEQCVRVDYLSDLF